MKRAIPIIIAFITPFFLIGIYFLYTNLKETNEKYENLLYDYKVLKGFYERKIKDLEKVTFDDDSAKIENLRIKFKQTLIQIKTEKKYIEENRRTVIENFGKYDLKRSNSLEQANENQRETDEVQNMQIGKLGQQAITQNKEIERLKKENAEFRALYEQEKQKNERLNGELTDLNERYKNAEITFAEYAKGKERLNDLLSDNSKKLEQYKNDVDKYKSVVGKYAEEIKKVKVDCYFIYKENSSAKEAKIYLDNNGLNKKYYQYFLGKPVFQKKRPNVYVHFKLRTDLFSDMDKLDLVILDANNNDIYNGVVTTSEQEVTRMINGDRFGVGHYYVKLKLAGSDLIENDFFDFEIKLRK